MNDQPLLKCTHVSRSFTVRGKELKVLNGVDLEVYPGELVVIRGRSGQGKSVLQWILSGIDEPSSGEVILEGTPFNRYSREELSNIRRTKIGLIFQNFNLIPSWNALENVEAALRNSPLSPEEITRQATSILHSLDLGERLYNLPLELSIGQQQRVALARALVNNPSLIIADEPTGSVDDETASEMMDILIPYVREKKSAMIVTTHGHFTGMHLADRILTLSDGKLVPLV